MRHFYPVSFIVNFTRHKSLAVFLAKTQRREEINLSQKRKNAKEYSNGGMSPIHLLLGVFTPKLLLAKTQRREEINLSQKRKNAKEYSNGGMSPIHLLLSFLTPKLLLAKTQRREEMQSPNATIYPVQAINQDSSREFVITENTEYLRNTKSTQRRKSGFILFVPSAFLPVFCIHSVIEAVKFRKPILFGCFILLFSLGAAAQDSTKAANDTSCHCNVTKPPAHTFDDWQSYIGLSPLLSRPDDANSIQLDVDFHLNSNAVMTTFAGAFLTQGYISSDLTNRVLSYAKKDIKYEDELKAGLAYKHWFRKKGITLYVSYYHRNMRQLLTSRDAFELVFEGNKPFENQTASLNDINFQNLMYNQYSIGVSKTDGHFTAGINVSYLQGFSNQQVKNPNGSLYTAPYGEYLDAAYNFTFNEATTGASRFFDLNGQGVSADLQFSYSNEKTRFSLTVEDLGYITWGKHPVNYRADTSLTFSGISVTNLTNISGSGIQGLNLDSVLSTLSPKKSNSAYNTTLPATIQATFSQLIKLKKHDMIFTAGVNTRLLTDYYAYGYVKTTFLLDHQWATSVSAGAGGYSLFNLGFDVGKKWKNLDILLGTNNLIGCLVPMYYPGSSFYLRLAAHF
jgi:hypothetical protein